MAIQKSETAWVPPPLPAPPPEPAALSKGAAPGNKHGDGFDLFGEDGLTFADLIDVVNPLQHIPIVSAIYRSVTGDQIAAGPRIAGGALFGGPIGAAVATVNASIQEGTGKDVGGHVMALFERPGPNSGGTVVASAEDEPPKASSATAAGSSGIPQLSALAPLPATEAAPAIAATVAGSAGTPRPPVDLAALAPLPSVDIAPEAIAAVQSALQTNREDASRFAAPQEVPVQTASVNGDSEPGTRRASPPGAMAQEGGWFTEVMLAALEQSATIDKYNAAARLSSGVSPSADATGR